MMDRPKFKELRYHDGMTIPEEYDIVQLKMDGMWGCMVMSHGEWTIYSRTGKLKASGHMETYDRTETIILGEFMKSSHWAHRHDVDGNFYAFDCVKYKGQDLTEEPLVERLHTLNEYVLREDTLGFVYPLKIWRTPKWRTAWDRYVMGEGYEGLVFKNSSSFYHDKNAWARMKTVVEVDYTCVGFRPADKGTKYEGQVGAVIGTLADKDVYVTCAGLTDVQRELYTEHPTSQIGKVFTAKGNGWYPSGSIRHPKFKMWREDKSPEECTYDQFPEEFR